MRRIWTMRATLVNKFLWLPAGVTVVQTARNTDGWVDAAHVLWVCYNDLLRIWLKSMKTVRRGLPLTLVKCLSPISVPFYSLRHSLWMPFSLLTFLSSPCFHRQWWKLRGCVRACVCVHLYTSLENTILLPWHQRRGNLYFIVIIIFFLVV